MDLITNVKKCKSGEELLLNTNGGQRLFDQKGVGVVIPVPMYYNKESICTIYAVKDILNIPGARITYNSELGRVLNVYVNDKIFKFEEQSNGLYGLVLEKDNDTKKQIAKYSFFSNQAIKSADNSIDLQILRGQAQTHSSIILKMIMLIIAR